MPKPPALTLITALIVAAVALSPELAAAEPPQLYDYTVQPGDTCVKIARRELGGRNRYKLIHRHNPRLGPTPHKLKPGSVLRLPRRQPASADAQLTQARGAVRVRQPARDAWDAAQRGMDLFRAWRVNARARASAAVTFRDRSQIVMRENTVVVIYGPRLQAGRKASTEAHLERGALRSRLGELTGSGGGLRVVTPSSQAELEQGSAVVSVAKDGASAIANHDGKPARVRGRSKGKARGRAVRVAPGMGTTVKPGKRPEPPRPLPATPAWAGAPASFVGPARSGVSVGAAWRPVDGAAEYRIELARDDAGLDLVTSVVVPASVTAFEAHRLPAGQYRATVSARDAAGLESPRSELLPLRAVAVTLVEPGLAAALQPAEPSAAEPDLATPPVPPSVLTGTRIGVVDGTTCAAATGDTLTAPGPTRVACTVDGSTTGFDVIVAPLDATMTGPGRASEPLPRGEPVTVEVALASTARVPKHLRAEGDGIEVLDVRQDGPVIAVTLRARDDADDLGVLRVVAGRGDRVAVLASLPLTLAPAAGVATARAPAPAQHGRRLSLGLLVGLYAMSDTYELGNSTAPFQLLDSSALFGTRVALGLSRYVELELELTITPTQVIASSDDAVVLSGRLHAVVPLWPKAALSPFALAGAGADAVFLDSELAEDDVDGVAHWGIGGRWRIDDRKALRLDARQLFGPARNGGATALYQLSLGVAMSWRGL